MTPLDPERSEVAELFTPWVGAQPSDGLKGLRRPFTLLSCLWCGAIVLVTQDKDEARVHWAWHRNQDEKR